MENKKIRRAFAALFALLLFPFINAAEISYSQDGFPYVANGTATSGIANINLPDLSSYNVTEALVSTESTYSDLVLNGNFTGGSGSNWAYAETDPSGRASSAFLTSGGDDESGRWRFRMTDSSNFFSYDVVGNLTNDGVFWDGSAISGAILNLSFIKEWQTLAPIENTVAAVLIRPDGSQVEIWSNDTIFDSSMYERLSIPVGTGNFTQAGTYRLRLFNRVVSPTRRSTVSNYWDQISLTLVKTAFSYSYGVWHNSSSINVPANLNEISEINVTLRFLANTTATPAIGIFNFQNGAWENSGCTPSSAVAANARYLWNCIIASSPQNYISTDGSRRIRMRLYTPGTDNLQTAFSEDWLNYKITYAIPQAFVNADKPSYSSCGRVYYRAEFFDSEHQLYTQAIWANMSIFYGNSMLLSSVVPVGGGTLESVYLLPLGSASGDYTIKALSGAIGRKYFHVSEGSADVWKMALSFIPDQGKYSASDSPSVSLTVLSQKGMGIDTLVLNGNLLLFRDASPYSPAILNHGNGTYSFNLAMAGLAANASHQLRAVANSSGINATASRGFFIG
ncbi:MAG: hypothetical protein ABIG96_03120 [Candidatus Micrarchaeota archaeon]